MKNIFKRSVIILVILNSNLIMAQSKSHVYDKAFIKENKLSSAVVHEVIINSNKEKVWALISNWGDAYIYTPGLDKSYCTGEEKSGLKSKRHCDIGKGYVEEEVLIWEEGSRFVQQVYEMDKIPMMKKIIVELEVIEVGEAKSKLIYAMAYKMPLGKLMKGMISKNIKTNALATKHYIETGDSKTSKDPKLLKKLYH